MAADFGTGFLDFEEAHHYAGSLSNSSRRGDSTFKQLTVEIRETLVCLNWLAAAKVLQFGETVLGSADSGITRGFPLVKSTCHAGNICKPCLEQDVTSLRTAVSRAANYNNLLVFRQLIDPIR